MNDPHIELWLYASEIRMAIGALEDVAMKVDSYGAFAGMTRGTAGKPSSAKLRELKAKLIDVLEGK